MSRTLGLALLMVLALVASAHAQTVTLGALISTAAGTNPTGLAVGDLNGDGRLDLVVTNGTPGTISVLLGGGAGTFAGPTSFTVGTTPQAVALGDLDRDGSLDAVVANTGAASISILLGNGAGGFGAATTIPVGTKPTAVAIGDLNGDGRPDLVVANSGVSTVTVLLGNGAGGFSLVGDFPTGPNPSGVALADVTGDNVLDVIVSNRDTATVSVFPGSGTGILGPRQDFAAADGSSSVAVGDLNGDARPDIAVTNVGNLNTLGSVLRGTGNGGFLPPTSSFSDLGVAVSVAITDLNGDGRPDLALAQAAPGAMLVLVGNGTGSLGGTPTAFATAATSSAIAVGDFDRDGKPDLVTANPSSNSVTVRLNTTVWTGAGAFVATSPIAPASSIVDPQPIAIMLGDVRSSVVGLPGFDGVIEPVVVDDLEVSVGFGGVGGFSPPLAVGGATAAALADVNGDGLLDLVIGRSSGLVTVLRGTGGGSFGGSFGPSIDASVSFPPISIAVGDLDRDGRPDLVLALPDGDTVVALRGSATGTFSPSFQAFLGTGSFPRAVALADLNRDGVLDLIVAHANGLSVLLGNGTGGFGAQSDIVTGVLPVALAVGDVNRDGRLDIAFVDADANSLTIMGGDGAGNFPARADLTGFAQPSAVALADLNRDGVLDLVVLNFGDQTLSVRLGTVGFVFSAPTNLAAGPDPFAFAIGDVNGDGRLDLAVLGSDRRVRFLLNVAAGAGTIGFAEGTTQSRIQEGGGATLLRITRSGGTAPATVNFTVTGTAAFGVDYSLSLVDPITNLAATGTLTFAQGETTKTLNLRSSPFTDAVVEVDQTVVVTLSAPGGGATLGPLTQLTVTIGDRDEALSFSQPVVIVTEGEQATATVLRRGDLQGTVTVRFKAVAGSATAGSDFVMATGMLTFPPGVAQQTFTVRTNADTLREPDETIILTLTEAKSTVFSRTVRLEFPAAAQVDVRDASGALIRFASATATVAEGAITNVVLSRTGALTETATATVTLVLHSAVGADFTLPAPAPLSVVFAPGVTSQTIPVAAVNDVLVEGPEAFRLRISNVTSGGRPGRIGSPSDVLITIADDESAFGFADTFADRQLPEATPTATFTVVRSGPLTGTATIQARTVDGAFAAAVPGVDYQAVPLTTLTFPPGMATRTFTVPLLNDTLVDGPKPLQVALSSPTGGPGLGSQATSVVTLLDDDDGGVIQWQKAATTVSESAATAVLTVTRTLSTPGRRLASGVTVGFAVTGGTATNGVDYNLAAGTLTFAAAQTSQTVTVPIIADSLDEADETVQVTLGNPQGTASLGALVTTALTITDNDTGGLLQFAAGSATVAEDSAATFNVRINRTGANLASAVTVDFAVTGGTATLGADFVLPTGTLTFGAGVASMNLVLGRVNDGLAEGPETIILALANPTGGATLGALRTMVVTITGAENAVGFSLPAFSVTESTTTATITVMRTGSTTAAASVQVRTVDGTSGGSVATPGVDYLPVPPTTLTFGPGVASRTFTVPILNNTRRDGTRMIALALSNPSAGLALGTQRTAVLTIADNDNAGVIGFTADRFTASETTGQATLTLTRTGTALAGGVSVDFIATFRSRGSSPTQRQSGTVLFGPGQTAKTIVLSVINDTLDLDESAFVELSNPTGGATLGRSRTAVVITDNEAGGTVRFAAATLTAVEGSTAMLTVVRTGGLAGGVSVSFSNFAAGGITATNGLDFLLANGTLIFDEGETSKTILIPILSDALLEGPETIQVFLGNPTGGATLGTPSTAIVTILDIEAVVGFAQRFLTVSETAPSAQVTVLRSGPLTGSASVQVRTVEGAGGGTAVPDIDYRPVPLTTLTFGPGVALRTVTVPLLNDTTVDGTRQINLALSNPSGAALGTTQPTASVNITDSEVGGVVQFASDQFSASESAGVATLRVVRSLVGLPPGTTLGGGVSVGFVVTGGTATNGGVDFTLPAGTVLFGPNETFKDIVIPLAPDGAAEGPETVVVQLQSATGGAFISGITSTTLTIID